MRMAVWRISTESGTSLGSSAQAVADAIDQTAYAMEEVVGVADDAGKFNH